MRVLERESFDRLLDALRRREYELVGPTVRQGAIAFEPIDSSAEMPVGLTDEQDGGTYRLRPRDDAHCSGTRTGPVLEAVPAPPGAAAVAGAARLDGKLEVEAEQRSAAATRLHRRALVRPARDRSLDGALLDMENPNPAYAARREGVFVVALNCRQAGGTCFCVSMETGPRATFGYDIALTEVIEDGRHWFLVEAGSEAGAEVLAELPDARDGREADVAAADRAIERAASRPGPRRWTRPTSRSCSYRNYEHPRWDEVADRCLTCGNCTMVCPTCFCTTVEDVTDLDRRHRGAPRSSGTRASRWTSPTCTAAACARPASRATASG